MKLYDILKDSITVKEVISKLGLNLDLKDYRSSKFDYRGKCFTGHPSESGLSFHVSDRGYNCLSCGEKGNIFELVKKVKGVEYEEARNWLVDTFKPELRKHKRTDKTPQRKYNSDYYNKALLYEKLYEHGKELLYSDKDSDKGDEALGYLVGDRGYDLKKLQLTEWFYLPTDKEARDYLLYLLPEASPEIKKFITGEWIDKKFTGLNLQGWTGDKFRLAFPYRDKDGNITGFLKRSLKPKGETIKGRDKPTRWDSTVGVTKDDLFNLWRYKNAERLLLLEGYPDALYFHTLGIETIALGQGAIGERHIESLVARGVKSVIISLDNDGEEKGLKHTKTAIKLLLKNNITPFVIDPTSLGKYKDLDELLKGEGEKELKKTIDIKSQPYYLYLLGLIFDKYNKLQDDKGELSSLDHNDFLQEVISLAQSIESGLDRDRLLNDFLRLDSIKALGINKESLEDAVEKIRYKKEEAQRNKDLKKLLQNAKQLQEKGDTTQALEKLREGARDIKKGGEDFSKLLVPTSEEQVKEKLSNKPDSINSGYIIEGEELLLEAGALSIFAAPTSHGKTTFLENSSLA